MTDARMRGNPIQNLKVFQGLCGKNNLGAVVFGITKSGKYTPDAFARCEKQLSDVYWKDFKKQGATVFKLLPSHESAGQLVKKVLDRLKEEEHVLRDLVEVAKILPVTKAGKELKDSFQEIIDHHKRAVAGDTLTEEQTTAHEQKIATVAQLIKQRALELTQRLLKFFGLVSGLTFCLSMYDLSSLCLRAVEDATGWSR